jgi:L-ribulose-5-phosphate 3-epimerase
MTDPAQRIGFMQGRLSPIVDGKIQAFPWAHWREEFPAARRLGLGRVEWTLDHERLFENPIMSEPGRREIADLAATHGVKVSALTGDLFMQAPFWKAAPPARDQLVKELDTVLEACAATGVREIVVPLVDNGSIGNAGQAEVLHEMLLPRADRLRRDGLVIAFESDFPPAPLAAFIAGYPADVFGINYDTGNSAALGYDCGEELAAYLPRILHVHVKDRVRGGTTVPLGTGSADLPRAIRLLQSGGYRGDYVLQTARAAGGDHAGALARYRAMTLDWIGAG